METRNSNTILVSGDAVCFHSNAPLARAKITRLEDKKTIFADEKGSFSFEWQINHPLTLFLEMNAYRSTQSATFIFTEAHLKKPIKITFQVPHWFIFPFFSVTMLKLEKRKLCQIAGTVTACEKTFDDLPHGEPGVAVQLYDENKKALDYTPHYFGIFEPITKSKFTQICSRVWGNDLTHRTSPFKNSLNETSLDGGFIFMNIPPGKYIVKATKTGIYIPEVEVIAKKNGFVNIFPGVLQAAKGKKKDETKPVLRKASHYSFFKNPTALAFGAGILGIATYGVGAAALATLGTYVVSYTAGSLSDCCKNRR